MHSHAKAFFIGSLLLLSILARAAEPVTAVATSTKFRVELTPLEEPVEINRIHSWNLHIEDADGVPVEDAEIEISGGMPAHDHGLPTAPMITQNLGTGDYLVEGMRFHMQGQWEILIKIRSGALRETLTVHLDL